MAPGSTTMEVPDLTTRLVLKTTCIPSITVIPELEDQIPPSPYI